MDVRDTDYEQTIFLKDKFSWYLSIVVNFCDELRKNPEQEVCRHSDTVKIDEHYSQEKELRKFEV